MNNFANYMSTCGYSYMLSAIDTPAVRVTTKKKIAHGNHFAPWIDLEKCADVETLLAVAGDLHIDEPTPDFVIVEGRNVCPALVPCHGIDDDTFALLMAWSVLPEADRHAFDVYCALADNPTCDGFTEAYLGTYKSKEAFARDHVSEYFNISDPRVPWQFFDYEKFAEWLFKDLTYIDGVCLRLTRT